MAEVLDIYEANAQAWDRDRGRSGRQLLERQYLDLLVASLEVTAPHVLDLGCGAGDPIARYLMESGCRVTGVDGADAMVRICANKFPQMDWIVADMRALDLGQRFDAIIAWDSFFHLEADAQRAMFPIFAQHIAPRGLLLYTSGPSHGEAIGEIYGRSLYHASLAADEYRSLLSANGFTVLVHTENDPQCGGHTVWLAQAA